SYGGFKGTIPPRQYGAGEVIVWDHGTWEPVGKVQDGLDAGKLVFRLHGEKLAGLWELVRTSRPGDKRDNWLLFKKRDEWARDHGEYDVTQALPDSVIQHPLGLLEARGTQAAPASVASPMASPTTSPKAPLAIDTKQAPKAALPDTLSPQLATLAKQLPVAGEWVCEFKFDGYRLLARIERRKARLFTRNGHDWTDKMPDIARDIAQLGIQSGWLDGEVVALGDNGLPSFNALQNAFDASRTGQLIWYVFDVPYLNGRDLRRVPLTARRALLAELFKQHTLAHIRFSEALPGDTTALWRSACGSGLEGLMVKRADAPYVNRRSEDWLKIKCAQRQEFVILGYTERSTGHKSDFGSLLLGYHEQQGRLRYAGNVGTGWDSHTRASLYQRMQALETDEPPDGISKPKRGRWSIRAEGIPHWLRPELVAEVSFAEWTPDGHVRHASFQGMREDKPASHITRETPMETADTRAAHTPKSAKASAKSSTKPSAKPSGKQAPASASAKTSPSKLRVT